MQLDVSRSGQPSQVLSAIHLRFRCGWYSASLWVAWLSQMRSESAGGSSPVAERPDRRCRGGGGRDEGPPPPPPNLAVERLDKNGDGTISSDELQAAAE